MTTNQGVGSSNLPGCAIFLIYFIDLMSGELNKFVEPKPQVSLRYRRCWTAAFVDSTNKMKESLTTARKSPGPVVDHGPQLIITMC